MAAEEHTIPIKCNQCGKKISIKTEFYGPTDITHIVEMVLKLEEKGWECPAKMTGYNTVRLYISPKCEACVSAQG